MQQRKQVTRTTSSPPVLRTIGIEPYLIAVSWVSPHGSNIEGTRMKSEPAYIYKHWILIVKKCTSNTSTN